jgi:hypothetical protein
MAYIWSHTLSCFQYAADGSFGHLHVKTKNTISSSSNLYSDVTLVTNFHRRALCYVWALTNCHFIYVVYLDFSCKL